MKILIIFFTSFVGLSTQFGVRRNILATQDEFIYFTDESNTTRSWAQAQEFCRSEGAEIAKIKNLVIYNQIRLSFPNDRYWIDGVEPNSPLRFQVGSDCSSPDGIDYTGIPVILSQTCLSLVRGSTADTSRIEAVVCETPAKVVCGYPKSGCLPGGTTPTPPTEPPTPPPTPPPTEAPTPPPEGVAKKF